MRIRNVVFGAGLLCFLSLARALAQEEVGIVNFDLENASVTVPMRPTAFVKKIAERLDAPLENLEKLEKRGYGRTEMISLVMISKKSPKKWEDLIKQREKGARLRKIAEEEKLDYNEIFRAATRERDAIYAVLRSEGEKDIVFISTSPLLSPPTSAIGTKTP